MDSIKYLARFTAQTLKRDFIAIALAIILATLILCGLSVYSTYKSYREKAQDLIANNAHIVARSITDSLDYAGYLMQLLGSEVVKKNPHDLQAIAEIFEPFAHNLRLQNASTWSVFSWATNEELIRVASNKGVLKEPLNISGRDYLKQTHITPWKLQLSSPVKGAVSKVWIIPSGMGITDQNGAYVGTITMGFDLKLLASKTDGLLTNRHVYYRLLDEKKNAVPEFSNWNEALPIGEAVTVQLGNYPYYLVVGLDDTAIWDSFIASALPISIQIFMLGAFMVLMVFMLRKRVVQPAIRSAHEKEALEKDIIGRRRQTRNLVHDLRAHASIVITFADIISKNHYGRTIDPQYADYANDIHRSGNEMLAMVNEMLEVEKAKSGNLQLDCRPIDPQTTVEQAVRCFETKAALQDVRIHAEIPANLPKLIADERCLKRILQNLLSNALKFTRKGGSVHILYELDEANRPVIRVMDTGTGMSQEDISIALTEYGQIRGDLMESHEGTGIGLPFVKQMMEAHGGHLDIESAPGEGTCISLVFSTEAARQQPKLTLVHSR